VSEEQTGLEAQREEKHTRRRAKSEELYLTDLQLLHVSFAATHKTHHLRKLLGHDFLFGIVDLNMQNATIVSQHHALPPLRRTVLFHVEIDLDKKRRSCGLWEGGGGRRGGEGEGVTKEQDEDINHHHQNDNNKTRHDTTRHDTTRHDTTRHDTTRHDTTNTGVRLHIYALGPLPCLPPIFAPTMAGQACPKGDFPGRLVAPGFYFFRKAPFAFDGISESRPRSANCLP
jgi:hypothetical protein